ncbi:hypothetical protein EPUS_04902 [Endocarpon pusillum Z07020]|uniref:Zn(2)-C6 fungal-type domain-containing protein n=1 Tax=Endocarpon pusillum (strain Z07020 / HMAS-L-300199) TaxID=1263415 RepID=U1GQW9_ENDPU|nr:uncharacterized protein EPUS_04902 [Endocarpon pusillum Z07020]ERF74733.1 hypothetical protein EPUS_04902 [Endocarpon pusillum Z07020]
MKEEEERQSAYPPPPPPGDHQRGSYYPAPDSRPPPSGEDRNGYAQDPPRPGPYPSDPRAPAPYPNDPRQPGQYPPPSSWHHPPPGHYPPPHPQYPDPTHPAYHYHPGPPADMSQPPQPRHPDPYRLPPPYPYPGYGPPHPYPQPPPPAPRQRTAIACKYCRKRKIRCSGYESSQDGRCNNCVRFNQSCLFHPVSSQAAFVPAQAVYPNMQNPRGEPPQTNSRGDYRPQGLFAREGESPPMLYGAHGIPLAPAAAQDHHQNYPPPQSGYPPPNYPPPPHSQGPPAPYDYRGQGPPPPPQADENVSRKRGPPDDDPHNESAHSSQSPHPSTRPRFSHEPRNSTANGYDYPDPTNIAPTSPSTSTTSYQSGYPYTGSAPQTARRHSPQSAHSYDSPRTLPIRDEGRSPPPGLSGSAPGSANGRANMSVQSMLDNPRSSEVDSNGPRRHKDDSDMLSKLDGKK